MLLELGQVTSSKVFKLQRYFSAFPSMVCRLTSQVKSSFVAKPRLSVSNMSTENCTSSTWLAEVACWELAKLNTSSKITGLKHPDVYPRSVRWYSNPSNLDKSKRLFNTVRTNSTDPLQHHFRTNTVHCNWYETLIVAD